MKERGINREIRSESAIIKHYLGAFNHIFDRREPATFEEYFVQHMAGKDEDDNTSYGIRIVFDRKFNTKVAALLDYDDNLVDTTKSKKAFTEACSQLVPDAYREALGAAQAHINRAARVLPEDGTHPERYAPLLELIAMSSLVEDFNKKGSAPTNVPQNELEARVYIDNLLKDQSNLAITRQKQEDKHGVNKTYFREKEEQAAGIDFVKQPPQGVSKDVWDRFRATMANAEIPDNEIDNFDIPEDARFIIATFGQLDQQLEKLAKAMRLLKKKGKRLPDEIIVITDGRKKPILQQIVAYSPDTHFVYGDDSISQLEKMKGQERVILVRGLREGTKRAKDPTPEGVRVANMAETRHSAIIFDALHNAA